MKGKEFVRVEKVSKHLYEMFVGNLGMSYYSNRNKIAKVNSIKQELRKLVDSVIGENKVCLYCKENGDSIYCNTLIENDLRKEQRQRAKSLLGD